MVLWHVGVNVGLMIIFNGLPMAFRIQNVYQPYRAFQGLPKSNIIVSIPFPSFNFGVSAHERRTAYSAPREFSRFRQRLGPAWSDCDMGYVIVYAMYCSISSEGPFFRNRYIADVGLFHLWYLLMAEESMAHRFRFCIRYVNVALY